MKLKNVLRTLVRHDNWYTFPDKTHAVVDRLVWDSVWDEIWLFVRVLQADTHTR